MSEASTYLFIGKTPQTAVHDCPGQSRPWASRFGGGRNRVTKRGLRGFFRSKSGTPWPYQEK